MATNSITLPTQVITNPPGFQAANSFGSNQSISAQAQLDPIAYLNVITFDGVNFPVVEFEELGSHDLAVHKYPNLDAARVENTGRNPLQFHFVAILTNNIFPATREKWKAGTLFPLVYSQFLQSLFDTTDKILVHPYYGEVIVKTVSWKYSFSAKVRDGVIVDVVCMETISGDLESTISVPASSSVLTNTGTLIGNELGTTQIQALSPPHLSIGQMFAQISSMVSQISTLPANTINSLNSSIVAINTGSQGIISPLFYTAGQTISATQQALSLNKNLVAHGPISNSYAYNAGTLQAVGVITPSNYDSTTTNALINASYNVNNSPNANAGQALDNVIVLCKAMIAYYQAFNMTCTANIVQYLYTYLYNLQLLQAEQYSPNSNNWTVQQYYVNVPTTLYALSMLLNNSIDDLLLLNQNLGTTYLITQDTLINYYQAS